MLGSSRNWQTAGRELAAHYHVLSLDARNHGKSPHAPEMDHAAMAGDVIGWMDAHGIAQASFLGHSMGAKTAMLLACRHPHRVQRLIAVDIAPKDYHRVGHREEFAAMQALDLTRLASRADAEHQFEPRVPSLGMRKFLTTNLDRDEAGNWRWLVNLPVITAALTTLEKNSLRSDDRFTGPTLFIIGGRSDYVAPADHPAIRRHFPAALIETIAAAGHNPHMEQRAELVRLVLSAGTTVATT